MRCIDRILTAPDQVAPGLAPARCRAAVARLAAAALALLAFLCLPAQMSAQKPGRTPNTLAYDSTQSQPAATPADVAWLTGHWRGSALGGVSEEIWSAPEANSMMGMFRLMKDGATVFYEIMSIQPDGHSIVLVLKHFNADLTGWEERDEVLRFRLVKLTPTEAWFEGLTFRRLDADTLQVQLAIGMRDGTAREEEFRYARVK